MKNIYIILFILSFGFASAQIGINNPIPDPKAELDISSTTKGILIPRLVRGTTAPLYGIATPVPTGMLVYQTDAPNLASPQGFYYQFSGWVPFRGGINAWSPFGNAGINPAINFVGTILGEANPFSLGTNNTKSINMLQNGNIGINTITPAYALDIVGRVRFEDGTQGIGKLLATDASGFASWRTPASLGFSGWGLTGNAGTTPATNFLGTSDLQDFVIKTDNIEKFRIQADGNIRINVPAATGSQLEVRSNAQIIPTIRGVNTNSTAGTFSFGVLGEIRSTELGSNSLRGQAINPLSSPGNNVSGIGILGKYQTAGAGVFGRAWTGQFVGPTNTLFNFPTGFYSDFIAGRDYGVYGLTDYVDGTGVYGKNSNTTLGSAYGMYCEGNFAVSGVVTNGLNGPPGPPLVIYPNVKSASVPTTKGNQLVYCKESPELWFEDFGFGQLQNGSLHVALDDLFLETVFVDASHKMQVVLQEQAESNGLFFVIDPDFKGFTVKERKNGTSNASFSYSIMAKRRFYQDQRFGVDANVNRFGNNLENMKNAPLATTDPMVMKMQLEKAIAEKNKLRNLDSEGKEIKKEQPTEKDKEASKTSN